MSKSRRRIANEVSSRQAKTKLVNKELQQIPKLKALNPNQADYLEALEDPDVELIVVFGPAGSGKAQPLTSKILTPDGWKFMGDIKVGDRVTAADGSTTKVTGVFPQGVKQIYKITFSDGSSTECCGEHLWKVYPRKLKYKSTKVVWNTLEIKRFLEESSLHSVTIDLFKPDKTLEDVDLPIHPYVLGILIGDGCLLHSPARFTTADIEIVERLKSLLNKDGFSIEKPSSRKIEYTIKDDKRVSKNGQIPNRFTNLLRELGVWGHRSYTKSIPKIYFKGSYQQRLELIQGLLDSDGTVCRFGSISFCSVSQQLALDFRELCWSIGAKAKISTKKTKSNFGVAYNVSVSFANRKDLFYLPRKKEKAREKYEEKQLKRKLVSIEEVGEFEAQCIQIEHPSHLYVTDDYIVTHNTYLPAVCAAIDTKAGDYEGITITRPTVPVSRTIGHLPGDLREKLDPWVYPILEPMKKVLGEGCLETWLKNGTVEIVPFEVIRGRTFNNRFVILDEAQNATYEEVKAFTTRIGTGSKVVINGDVSQSDLKTNGTWQSKECGLAHLLKVLDRVDDKDKRIRIIEFTTDDIVRSGLCKDLVIGFNRYEAVSV